MSINYSSSFLQKCVRNSVIFSRRPGGNGDGDSMEHVNYHKAPPYLRCNPFIQTGYRTYQTYQECIRGIFRWNNETINIWTNVLDFFFFVILLWYDLSVRLPKYECDALEEAIFLAMIGAYLFANVTSGAYHMFNCISEFVNYNLLTWDVCGVTLSCWMFFTCFVHIYFSGCFFGWEMFYQMANTFLIGVELVLLFNDRYKSYEYDDKRTKVLAFVVVSNTLALFHAVYLHGGIGPFEHIISHLVVMYTFFIGGFFMYTVRFPERLRPGAFDFFGSSHQLWHLGILITTYVSHEACFKHFETPGVPMCAS